jgi:DMSO/TMAO reductase YedYZ heme-binding membrane subunit
MSLQSGVDALYRLVAERRNVIVMLLTINNWLLLALLCIGSYSIVLNDSNANWFYNYARECGEYAVIFFILVSLPGIARRFRFSHKLIMILMMFRRQLGVLTYMFILIHAVVLRAIPWMTKEIPMAVEPFVLMGSLSSMVLFALFITSNDWSVRRLGELWGKLHTFIYVAVWFIFMHLALQGVSKWTVALGITAVLQFSSHIYASQRLRKLN